MASSATAARPFVEQGTARVLAIAAPKRQPGPLAQVATFKEQGLDFPLSTNWRGIFGAPGLAPPQVAFWEDAFAKMVATEDWKQAVEKTRLTERLRGPFERVPRGGYQVSRSGAAGIRKAVP